MRQHLLLSLTIFKSKNCQFKFKQGCEDHMRESSLDKSLSNIPTE